MRVIVEADGGSRGNPGPAGYGAVVLDPDGETVLAERAESLGVASNNVAEYRGLIAGLEAALEMGADEVAVRMDSKLVVEQMSGRWQVKHPDMRPLARRASGLVAQLRYVTFEWIPRERNTRADRLANLAMDRAAGRAPSAPAAVKAPRGVPSRATSAELGARVVAAGGHGPDPDPYRVQADPGLLRELGAAVASLLPPGTELLAGVAAGGLPLVTALAAATGTPARFVLPSAEEPVAGGPVDGRRTVLVTDVVRTGATALVAASRLRAAGAVVADAVCLVDAEQDGAEALTEAGVRLWPLLLRSALAAVD